MRAQFSLHFVIFLLLLTFSLFVFTFANLPMGYNEWCDFQLTRNNNGPDCADISALKDPKNTNLNSYNYCPSRLGTVVSNQFQGQRECTQDSGSCIPTPIRPLATIQAQTKCDALCIDSVNKVPISCDATLPASSCSTCKGCTIARTVSCQGTTTYDQGISASFFSPQITNCSKDGDGKTPAESVTITDSCKYTWSTTTSGTVAIFATGATCPNTTCGACSNDADVKCVATEPGGSTIVGGAVDKSFCSGAGTQPIYKPNTCTYRWSLSSSLPYVAPTSSPIACPNQSTCGSCAASVSVTCLINNNGVESVTAPGSCVPGVKPYYTTACAYQWSLSTSGTVLPLKDGIVACPANNCGTCSENAKVKCVPTTPTTSTIVGTVAVDESLCNASGSKPKYIDNVCTYRWSLSPSRFIEPPARSPISCPSQSTCGSCAASADVTCLVTQDGKETATDPRLCDSRLQPIYTTDCDNKWSLTTTGTATALTTGTTCPTFTNCGTCPANVNVKCVATTQGTSTIVGAVLGDASCPPATKPKYADNVCDYKWSTTTSGTVAIFATGATCPNTTCGACSNDADVKCVSTKPSTSTIVGTVADALCPPATKPIYKPNTCTYRWSLSSSLPYVAPTSSPIACPNQSTCGSCAASVSVTCLINNNGVESVTAPGSCVPGVKPYYTTACAYQWSLSTSGTATALTTGTTCPTFTNCGTCPANVNVKCVATTQGTSTIVGAVLGDASCPPATKPKYADNVCDYKWSTTTSGSVAIFATGATCPAFTNCGTCSTNSNVKCVPTTSPASSTIVGTVAVADALCPPATKPTYANNVCDYKWSLTTSGTVQVLSPGTTCPNSNCGTCSEDAKVRCVSTKPNTSTIVDIAADPSCLPAIKPTYTRNVCDFSWSLSSTKYVAPTSSPISCPNQSTCGSCAASADVTCFITKNGEESPTTPGSCVPGVKPYYTTDCDNKWSLTTTGTATALTTGTTCPTFTNCGTCPANVNVKCVATTQGTSTIVGAVLGDASCPPATKPKYADNVCDYKWSTTTSGSVAIFATGATCPNTTCGACSNDADVKCVSTKPSTSTIVGTVADALCPPATKPIYKPNTCTYRWSTTSAGYVAPAQSPISCPNQSTCGSCAASADITCFITNNGVESVTAPGSCVPGVKPYYTTACAYQWSLSTSGTVSTLAPNTTCPTFTNCGTCPANVNVKCVATTQGTSVIIGSPLPDSQCPPLTRPKYADNVCDYKWSLSATSFTTPPTSSTICPTQTSPCDSCNEDSNVVCIATRGGTSTSFLAKGMCSTTQPKYKPVSCLYRCRAGVGTGSVVDCPLNKSKPCECSNPTCTFTAPMECYNADAGTFVLTGCTGSSTFIYNGDQPVSCNFRWSYTPIAPFDLIGRCPDQQCAQSCPTKLLSTNVRCVTSNDAGLTYTFADENDCLTIADKPLSYVPYTNCKWICTSPLTPTMEVVCDESFVSPCKKCNDPTSVPFTRTRCSNVDTGAIANAIGNWCGTADVAVTTISRQCPTCQWLCRNPTDSTKSIPCQDITAATTSFSKSLECSDCAQCTKSFQAECWNNYNGGAFVAANDPTQCTGVVSVGAKPAPSITAGIPHVCSWECAAGNKKLDCNDLQLSPKCPVQDCLPCDQTVTKSCWDVQSNVIAPGGQCSGTAPIQTVPGIPFCIKSCPTCIWGCRSSNGSYKPCTDAEFTTQCPIAGDIACQCDIPRDVQCVDFGTTPASSTTLATSAALCAAIIKPDETYINDRSAQCKSCATTKPYWTGIDCSIGPQIESFDIAVSAPMTSTGVTSHITIQNAQAITYNDVVEFSWKYTGLETNIATISMTSSSIAPLKSIIVSSFLAKNNSFALSLSTLPFNMQLVNVQFYVTIGGSALITPTLPSPIGFTIAPRCANMCTHNGICNETTGVCACDLTSVWTRGIFCEQSVCSALNCVADHTNIDPGSGDVCHYVAGPNQPQCNCKSDTFTGTRCQNECSLVNNSIECPTTRGQAELRFVSSPDAPDVSTCSCQCIGNFGGNNCSTCQLQCKNSSRVNSGCTQCACSTASSSGYFWFGRLCSCQALSLSLTINKMSTDLYSILQSGYTDFSEAVNRVMDEYNTTENSQGSDTDIRTDDDKAIFNIVQNGKMKAFMTSLLISILTDYHDTLIRAGLSNSNLFVKDSSGQFVLNADSITNVVSIREMQFKTNPTDSSLNTVSINIAIVPQTCHDSANSSPIDSDAWDPTKSVVNYLDSWLGKDDYSVAVVDPECVGSICQSALTPVPTDPDTSNAVRPFSSLFIFHLSFLSLLVFIFAIY